MDFLRDFIVNNPILAASLSSLWGAILIDLVAFKNSKDPGGFFNGFDFRTAGWRYLQGFIGGFVGNAAVAGLAGAAAGAATALFLWMF